MTRGNPHELTFADLRRANILRLGQIAHRQPDGSDWTPAQWLMAVVGELGEYAEVRWQYENGYIDFKTYQRQARAKLADVMIYLDILAMRCMDTTTEASDDHAAILQKFIMFLGGYANARKKMIRGDIDHAEFRLFTSTSIDSQMLHTMQLMIAIGHGQSSPTQTTTWADSIGVRLWQSVRDVFNKVSRRIGCGIEIGDAGVVVGPDREIEGSS